MILHIKVDISNISSTQMQEIQDGLTKLFKGYAISLSVEDPYDNDEEGEDYEDEEDEDEEEEDEEDYDYEDEDL